MPWPKGRPHSPETKAKITKSLTGLMVRENHPYWKGGRMTHDGYAYILMRDHPSAMSNGYVKEHRLIMEQHLGRYLEREEIVHHKNGDKTDNRIENMELMTQGEHVAIHRTGVPRSEETRRRISETRKERSAAGLIVPHNKGKSKSL